MGLRRGKGDLTSLLKMARPGVPSVGYVPRNVIGEPIARPDRPRCHRCGRRPVHEGTCPTCGGPNDISEVIMAMPRANYTFGDIAARIQLHNEIKERFPGSCPCPPDSLPPVLLTKTADPLQRLPRW